jgi:serine/threonine protein kinase
MEVMQTLGKYEIRGVLGQGAMGIVYDGWDPRIERRVAIKAVDLPEHPDPDTADAIARFRREAQAAGRLTHPNIVGVYDYGETADLAYIVMEFVDGTTLKALVDRNERFAVPEIRQIMQQILAGLQYSHEAGVVHRDIKPANIMLTSARQAKITDFGIARIESSSLTQVGTIMGTPAYMSPEQVTGSIVDERTDIYSSGVLLYQLLTGERPFDGGTAAIMHKVLHTEPPPPSELTNTSPVALDAVVQRAMAKRPDDRYQSAAEFSEAIGLAVAAPVARGGSDGEATLVSPPTPPADAPSRPASPLPAGMPARPPTGPSRVPAPAVAAGAAALVLLGAGGWWFAHRPSSPPSLVASNPTSTPAARPTGNAPAAPTAITRTPAAREQVAIAPPVAPQPATPSTNTAPHANVVGPTNAPAPLPTPISPPAGSQQNPPAPIATPTAAAQPAPNLVVAPTAPKPAPTTLAGPVAAPQPAPTTLAAPTSPPQTAPTTPTAPPPQVQAEPATVGALPLATPPVPRPVETTPATPPVNTAPSPAPVEVAAVGLTQVSRQLEQSLRDARCALVNGAIQDSGTITVSGIAARTADDSLRREVTDLAGSRAVDWRVQRIEPVFCDAIAAIHPVAAMAGARDRGLRLGLAGGRTVLRDGEFILPRVTMADFSGQLRVDYLAHDGTVAHLYPTSADQHFVAMPSRTLHPGERLDLGDPGAGHPQWDVGPPYGTDMIVAVASSVPLLDRLPPGNVDTNGGAYFRQLQLAIEVALREGADVTATALLVDTIPKQ